MNSKAIAGKICWEQNAKQLNPKQRQKGLGRISELSRLKLPARYTGVSMNRRQMWQGTLSREKGQLSQTPSPGEFIHLQDRDDTKLGRQAGVLGRMLKEPGDPHCTHALSYALVSRLAHCTLGLQRKMHSEVEAQIGRRTAHTQSLAPKACISRRNPSWGCSQIPHKDLWSSAEHQQYGHRTQVGCHCAQPPLDCAGQPG